MRSYPSGFTLKSGNNTAMEVLMFHATLGVSPWEEGMRGTA